MSTHESPHDFEEALTDLEQPGASTEPPGAPKPEPTAAPRPQPPLPIGTQPLLEAQLGEALKIMREYSDWVHLPTSRINDCIRVGDALGRVMNASAMLATVAVRLQKGEPETRHRMIVEHAAPSAPEGRGTRKVENE
jgi:hypothetical protein